MMSCMGLWFLSGSIAHALPVQKNTLYMCSLEAASQLYAVNYSNARKSLVGSMGMGRVCTDLAFLGTKLYAVSAQRFYTLNPTNGKVVNTKSHGFNDINALVAGAGSQLYAAGSSDNSGLGGRFIRIDSTTGKGKKIGYFGSGLTSSGDLVFLGGTLYATVNNAQSSTAWLAKINTTTGKATLIGNMKQANVGGLAVRNGIMYAATSNGMLLKVNPSTGKTSFIGINNVAQGGLAKSP